MSINMEAYSKALDKYIMSNIDVSNYDYQKPGIFCAAAEIIFQQFCKEKPAFNNSVTSFIHWTEGLPSILNCDYWLGGKVYEELSKVVGFEVTADMYDIDEACILFTKMLYLEILRGLSECVNKEMETAPNKSTAVWL